MRNFDTVPGLVVGVLRDRATAERATSALREGGFAPSDLSIDDPSRVKSAAPTAPHHWRPGLLMLAVTGAGVAVFLEATVLAVPASVPTIAGGSVIAAILGAAVTLVAATLVGVGTHPEAADEGRLMALIRDGRHIVTVSAADRFGRERARGMLQRLGASETMSLDVDESEVEFARPFSEVVPRLREHCAHRHGGGAATWERMLPAYVFGWDRANRPDHSEQRWPEAAAELRSEWSRRHPDRAWIDDTEAIGEGWAAARDG